MTFREKLYRSWIAPGLGRAIGQIREGRAGWPSERIPLIGARDPSKSLAAGRAELWFHAASAGELESLWPLIGRALAEGVPAVVTAFSRSAIPSLERFLRESGESVTGKLVLAGSPVEGSWARALAAWKPRAFITAKYEAWPELWMALASAETPLVIIGASRRRSLLATRALLRGLGAREPRYLFATFAEADAAELQEEFADAAEITVTGDPRWDRVIQRAEKRDPRVREIVAAASNLPRPWWVVGSAWREDLAVFLPALAATQGTVWVVPHSLAGSTLDPLITSILTRTGAAKIPRTSQRDSLSGTPKYILVDEMGFLAEFYGSCDFAVIGGGFGQGLHSTLEPAAQGLAVAAGPVGSAAFAEVTELKSSNQLTIVHDEAEARAWVTRCIGSDHARERAVRLESARARAGATDRAWSFIRGAC